MKYRIRKKEIVRDNGEVKVEYMIQKKFLWWWYCPSFTTHYFTHEQWNQGDPVYGALLTERKWFFSDEQTARIILEKIKTPFEEIYKGNVIERVFADHSFNTDVYINRCVWRIWNGSFCYEFGTLEEVKEKIDRRQIKEKKTYINE